MIAFVVWAAIAGLVWWIMLALAIVAIWRWRRTVVKAGAAEPPPRI